MKEQKLFNGIASRFTFKLDPFFEAALMECCEHVVNAKEPIPEDSHANSAIVAFATALNMLRATVLAALAISDTVTVNYRGQSFVFDKNHPLLKLDNLRP